MRGQAAVEWIVVLSVALMILAVMLSMNEDNYQFFNNNVKVSKAKGAVNDLKNAVDFVYSQGKDAKTSVYVTIPPGTNLTVDTLPAGKGQILAIVYVKGQEESFDAYTDANLTGSLPAAAGSYCIEVRYSGPEVSVSRSSGSC
jgi:hypothetical protein